MCLNLVETKNYKTKVGCIIHQFGVSSGIWGTGNLLEPGAHVMYDQYAEGWHIFALLEKEWAGHYIRVPDWHLEEEIEEVAP
jgi:hypothetical protein